MRLNHPIAWHYRRRPALIDHGGVWTRRIGCPLACCLAVFLAWAAFSGLAVLAVAAMTDRPGWVEVRR